MAPRKPDDKAPGKDRPHYHGHRERLRARLLQAGPEALPDYELLEIETQVPLFPSQWE